MSIGINSSTSYQPASTQLDFSALSGKSPQTNTFSEESTAQAVDPSALLFDTASQKDVSFGKPDNTVQSPTDSSAATDPQSNVVKLLSALVTSLLQMLMNLNKKQDTGQDSNEWQDPFQNNGGLGTPSTEGGGGGTEAASGGDDGGGGTEATSGGDEGGGGTTAATGGGDGGGTSPTTEGDGGGSYASTGADGSGTPSTEDGTGGGGSDGVTPQVTPQLANPGRSSGNGTVSDTTGSLEQSGNVNVLKDTIKVGPGQVFDGHGATFTADKSMGTGDQDEHQKPLFELAEGAVLKNVNLGENEADGIHVNAKNSEQVTIDNVHAQNVGEDMITVKGEGGAKVTNLNITNSSANGADDKVVQLNADTHLKVDGFKATDFGTLVRTNGGKQFDDMSVELNGVNATHGKFALVKSDSDDLKLATGDIAMTDVKHAYDKTKASTQHTEL
ncbi:MULTISPECIES: pectate lyase [Pseudomonas syringae group]|uniref:pectate lyase n=3 Tax=Pseudomonas syringae group TaxID=136849 RepID=F3G247_PSESJ|nr:MULTISPECIES: pectate lyase [Pseudomonas syringae group]EGH41147.1 type III helper protein HrpW1 [Pseudomonas syringae pv. pisi str. 1704B]PYD17113.1 type III effector HrpK [Pseudomonas syringae pv. pisi]PYD31842.1 type III effector HrpK [Pseudomonas syringae pv. pisi]PYD34783.1 type III effector HrpK [Pseudomonas syringae pv. pisi]RML61004.1 Type III helper protein HrpW1 [Pseudomonas syringae pv. pisi]